VIEYINAYTRHWLLYEEELLDGGKTKKIVYRYGWLIDNNDEGGRGERRRGEYDIQTLQDRIIQVLLFAVAVES
jgi:hypothetical protein